VPSNSEVVPLEQALAALDSPEALADQDRRAHKMAEGLEGDARAAVFRRAGAKEIDKIKEPFRRGHDLRGAELAAAERQAGGIADRVIFEQCRASIRAQDIAAIYADPDRVEAERVWNAYARGVSALAWAQGNGEPEFVARWRQLIAARADCEAVGDDGGVRAAEARLERLGTPYPQLPAAAWEAADALPEQEREAEFSRLSSKYGPRHPDTNGRRRTKATV
jgi:hypothetical protein